MKAKRKNGRISGVVSYEILNYLYKDLMKTDKEIAEFFKVHRTTVVLLRKRYGIERNLDGGRKAELMVAEKLRKQSYEVVDMNKEDSLSDFDLLVDGFIRIEVKSAELGETRRYQFGISEPAINRNIESETRIRLSNGRTRKLYSKTCDFIVFVCTDSASSKFYVMPSDEFPEYTSSFSISSDDTNYDCYKGNWESIKNARLQSDA